MTENKCTHN